MYFHHAIAHALHEQGTKVVFGVIGDGNLYMMDSFVRHAAGRYISAVNEAGAVLAANGYSSVSGLIGVASVTPGPALINTVTALAEGVKDLRPLVLIAADTAITDRDNFQKIAQREVVRASGAGFEQVRAPNTVAEDVAVAFRRAVNERRPIVLNVPVDFQWHDVESPVSARRYLAPQRVVPDADALNVAVDRIASAARPVVLAGRGRPPRPPAKPCCGWRTESVRPWPRPCAARISSAVNHTILGFTARLRTR